MVIYSVYLLTFVSLIYCFVVFKLIRSLEQPALSPTKEVPTVSIIVAVRNGRKHLRTCLRHLLRQTIPLDRRQIIFVDDHSTDGTAVFLRRAARRLPITVLSSLTNSAFRSSKKAALAVGIEHSNGEILLFTDVDCAPPPEWAQTMVSLFDNETLLTAGFSPQTTPSPLWSQVLLLDSAAAGIAAAAGIKRGRGVTCTGRNLAYRRSAYEAIGGFAALPNTLSGDDDFVLQRISGLPYGKVHYALCQEAAVPALGPSNLKAFLRQKQRHISAGTDYPFRAKLIYATVHAANTMIWCASFLFWISPLYLLPLSVKLAFDRRALQKFLAFFSSNVPFPAFFLWELLFAFYPLYCGLLARRRNLHW